jgi:hypothetical protein
VTHARPLVVVLPAFLLTRAAIFFSATSATDSIVYHQYGVAARVASVAELFRQHDTEYPQLAVAFSAGVGWLADQLPDGVEQLISARKSKPPDLGTARFQVALGLVLFMVDLAALALIALFSRKSEPREQTWRLGLYVAITAALGPILYDRLDLVVGFSAIVALAALARGWPIASYMILTAGAAFKIVPMLLAPVFVLAAAAQSQRFWPAFWRHSAYAGLILLAWPVLVYCFGGGDRAFVFLKYHSARGLELGSAYSVPVLLADSCEVRYEYGGYALRGSLADSVARASPAIAAIPLVLAVLVAGHALRRASDRDRVMLTASGCVLVWLSFILTGKVGSPQYLLWVAPLVPLLPLRNQWDYRAAGVFVAACVLTTLTYPYLWPNVHGVAVPDRPGVWSGPNGLGFALMIGRWLAIAGYTIWLFVRLATFTPEPASR